LIHERETLRYFANEIVGLKLTPGQERFVTLVDEDFEQLRIIVVRKGRRVGMTACAALLAAWVGTVLAPRFRTFLLPGEEFTCTLMATSRDQAAVLLDFVRRFMRASSMLEEQVVAETAATITLATGCVIEAVPCSARASRGRANGLVVLDEGAHFVDSHGNSSLHAVLDALRPPLAQFGRLGLMVTISTPLDASGAFYELEQEAASGHDDMAVLHLPTTEARPELAAEAERERERNPRRYAREWLGEYTSGEEAFPLEVFDACVDADYRPPEADPSRSIILAVDGAVNHDSMAVVGVDEWWNLVHARAWKPPLGGTIDHREVLDELLELARRFRVHLVAYDPAQIHWLVLEGLDAGLPMVKVSQAAGHGGGTMARYTAALLESLYAGKLRLFPSAELREHIAHARFTARTGADRLTKARSCDQIDLAVALAMAVGLLNDLWRDHLSNTEYVETVVIPAAEAARDYAQTRTHFWTTLAAEAAEAGDLVQARDLLDHLDLARDDDEWGKSL
jgi:hypothetical protein